MPIDLQRPTYTAAKTAGSVQSERAQAELKEIKTYVQAKANGSKFPGYLRLVNSQDEGQPLRMTRSRWFNRPGAARFTERKAAADYVQNLFRAAYGHRCTPQQYQALTHQIEQYLKDNSGSMGSHHFLRFLNSFEKLASANANLGRHEKPLASVYPAEQRCAEDLAVKARVRDDEDEGNGALPQAQACERRAKGVSTLLGIPPNQVKLLSTNTTEGEVYAAGSSQVYKHLKNPVPIHHNNLRKGEIAAAWLHDTPSVVTPTDFLVQVTKKSSNAVKSAEPSDMTESTLYRVPAAQFKVFVREQIGVPMAGYRPDDTVKLNLVGTLMPRASGQSMDDYSKARGPMPTGHFKGLAKGVVQGLEELSNRRAVIHDIKPANVMFDPLSGQARLIDLGGLDKLSKYANTDPGLQQYPGVALNQSRNYAGTDFTMSPRLIPNAADPQRPGYYLSVAHGHEVDRYSAGMTLLTALQPKMSSKEVLLHLSRNSIPPDTPSTEYLPLLLARLQDVDPVAAQALHARFQQEPELHDLIENCFIASEPSEAGTQAWQRVLASPVLAPEPLVQSANNEIQLSAQRMDFRPGVSIPSEGQVRAGQSVLAQSTAVLQKDLDSIDRGPVGSDVQSDPRFKQFASDVPRAKYNLGATRLQRGSVTALDRSLESWMPGPDKQVARENARLDLAQLLTQNTSGSLQFGTDINPFPGRNASEQARMLQKPWFSSKFDHPDFHVEPDPAVPGALLIDLQKIDKESTFYFENKHHLPAEGSPGVADLMRAQLRYTPSNEVEKPGSVEVLELRFAYQLQKPD